MDTVVQKKLNQILNKETTITSVANELGVSRQTLYKWLNQYKRQRGFPIFETQQKSHKAHNKISKDIEDLVISTAKDNPNDSVSTLATKLVTTYGVQLNPTTIFRVLKRNNIRYTPAVVPVRAPTALYVPETIPVSTELPTAKLSQGVLPHVAPTQLSSVTKAATVPTSAMSSHALALPSYFLRQITALVLVGVFGVVSLYGAYQFDGNTSSFTSGEPTAPPNFEVASKVVSVFDEVNPSPLSPSTFSLSPSQTLSHLSSSKVHVLLS
jgi:transposase